MMPEEQPMKKKKKSEKPAKIKETKTMSKAGKIVLWVLFGLVLFYFAGVYLFSRYTYPRTTMNGERRSFYRISEVVRPGSSDTPLSVEGRDGQKTVIKRSDIDLKMKATGNPVLQNSFAWPREIFRHHPWQVNYQTTYEKDKLFQLIAEGGFEPDGPMPVDAKLVVDEQGIRIQPEDPGNHIDGDRLEKEIVQGLIAEKKVLDVRNLYALPKKTREDPAIVKGYKILKKYEGTEITYDFVDKKYQFGIQEIADALTMNEDGTAAWNDQVLKDWVQTMAKETDTYGKERKFKTNEDKEITVPPGIYGWQIKVDETAKALKDALNEGGKKEMDPAYKNAGLSRGTNDIGDTYIEIDLSKQQMWCYMKGKLLFHGDVKSGAVNHFAETPVGVHKIWSHEKGKNLKGTRKDGSTYDLPVKYWMPINYGGVGLHDASWTKDFGGTYYIKDGSNGCINLPEATAKFIFENFPNNTPVVIYESTTTYSPKDKTF